MAYAAIACAIIYVIAFAVGLGKCHCAFASVCFHLRNIQNRLVESADCFVLPFLRPPTSGNRNLPNNSYNIRFVYRIFISCHKMNVVSTSFRYLLRFTNFNVTLKSHQNDWLYFTSNSRLNVKLRSNIVVAAARDLEMTFSLTLTLKFGVGL